MNIDMTGKHILDVTCGPRGIWFNKNHPAAVYCDRRCEEHSMTFTQGTLDTAKGRKSERHIEIKPDVIADFTNLPLDDCSFDLVVFDPPHLERVGEGWVSKYYGKLFGDWRTMIRDGFNECMRVLRPYGTLVFKWAETQIKTREIIDTIGTEPLFGHKSGTKLGTHWMCFMKGV